MRLAQSVILFSLHKAIMSGKRYSEIFFLNVSDGEIKKQYFNSLSTILFFFKIGHFLTY